jgi:aspartate racemase
VLGGMGPDATVDFLGKVIAHTPADCDQDHVAMLVDHNPAVPNRQQALLADGADPSRVIASMAERLQTAGADFLVMVCNSAHAFTAQLEQIVTVPLISIIDVTVDALPDDAAVVGVLATDGCLASGLFQEAIEHSGRRPISPDGAALEALMRAINRIKAGDQGEDTRRSVERIASELVEQGARAIIAGCTEIPLVLEQERLSVPLVSSTDELAKRTVELALGKTDIPKRN